MVTPVFIRVLFNDLTDIFIKAWRINVKFFAKFMKNVATRSLNLT